MTVADRLGLTEGERSALFYALLLKDAGCSSNASRRSALFDADDLEAKRRVKTVDWTSRPQAALYAAHREPGWFAVEKDRAPVDLRGPGRGGVATLDPDPLRAGG